MVFNISQHIQHKPTEIGHKNVNGNWWPKEQGLTAGLFLQLTTLPQVKKNWETQVTDFHVWSVLNLGLYIQKDVSTRITDHVSFSSCYVLLLKKNARFYDLVTSRAFHQDAILTHTAALALQAPDIYQRSETSLPPSLRVISRAKAYPGPSSKHLVK